MKFTLVILALLAFSNAYGQEAISVTIGNNTYQCGTDETSTSSNTIVFYSHGNCDEERNNQSYSMFSLENPERCQTLDRLDGWNGDTIFSVKRNGRCQNLNHRPTFVNACREFLIK